MRIDVHQHIWTQPLLDRLALRRELPLVRRERGLTVLHCAAERPYVIDVEAEAPARRAALVRSDGLDRALVAISSPVGIEALPRDSASELIDAHLRGVAALPGEFAAWGPIALDGADERDVDAVLARGCIGISLPAGALAGPERLWAAGPLLARAARLGVPVLVHPGRAPGARSETPGLEEPLWWRALTDYVAQMQAAWLTFATDGRRDHPHLVVVFAMLAGGAPLLAERLRLRGGPPIALEDPLAFYDTSGHGRHATDAVARVVGSEQLVYGSDRPVVEPPASDRDAALKENGAALFSGRLSRLGAAA